MAEAAVREAPTFALDSLVVVARPDWKQAERDRLRLPTGITVFFLENPDGSPVLGVDGRPTPRCFRAQLAMPDGRQHQVQRSTLAEARHELRALQDKRAAWDHEVRIGERHRDGTPTTGMLTFREAAERYLELPPHPRKPQSTHHLRANFEYHVYQHIGDKRLRDITPDDIEDIARKIPESHINDDDTRRLDRRGRRVRSAGPATVKKIRDQIASVLKWARTHGLIAPGPLPTELAPRPHHSAREMRVWDFDETARYEEHLRRVADGEVDKIRHYPPIGMLALGSTLLQLGPRIGECLALRWEDIDWTGRRIHFEGTVVFVGGLHRQHGLKTQPDGRYVSMPHVLDDILGDWREDCMMTRRRNWLAPDAPGALVFPALRTGGLWSEPHCALTLQDLMRDAGVPVLRLHELRATFISQLMEVGVNPLLIAKAVGHVTIEQILRVYAKVLPSRLTATAEAIDALRASFVQLVDLDDVIAEFLRTGEAIQATLRLHSDASDPALRQLLRGAAAMEDAAFDLLADLPADHPVLARVDAVVGMVRRARRGAATGRRAAAPLHVIRGGLPPRFELPPTFGGWKR